MKCEVVGIYSLTLELNAVTYIRSGVKLEVTKDEVIGMMVRGLTSEPMDNAESVRLPP